MTSKGPSARMAEDSAVCWRQQPFGTAEIVDCCARQRVPTWLVVIPQHVDEDLVPARQPLDEPEQRRDDAFAAAPIEAAGHHERDAHAPI